MTQRRNKLATHKSAAVKLPYFQYDAAQGALAYRADGTTLPLNKCLPSQVEFIGGLWRVQEVFPYKIHNVRGTDFVLHEKLAHQEKNLFEFYRASQVACNCYGYFIVPGVTKIVAKYVTDNNVYWAYGNTIEQARAFMGIKLYDENMDLIHSAICKNCDQRKK